MPEDSSNQRNFPVRRSSDWTENFAGGAEAVPGDPEAGEGAGKQKQELTTTAAWFHENLLLCMTNNVMTEDFVWPCNSP